MYYNTPNKGTRKDKRRVKPRFVKYSKGRLYYKWDYSSYHKVKKLKEYQLKEITQL